NGNATPSGTQSPQVEGAAPSERHDVSSVAWLPPLFFVRHTCWKPVNCVSGLTSSNEMNCRPVDAVMVTRSFDARIGSPMRTQRERSPLAKLTKKLLLWKLAKRTPARDGWKPDADVPSPDGNTLLQIPGDPAPSIQIVPLSWSPPISRCSGARGS